jgi:DNA invertase Pin-like site-specific DNA recombinase
MKQTDLEGSVAFYLYGKEDSIGWQLAACRSYFDNSDYSTVAGEYIDIGKPSNRPEREKLMSDAESKLFSAVIVINRDRFSRKIKERESIIAELGKYGVRVIALNELNIED